MFRLTAVFGLLLTICGCATLTQDECQAGDWHAIGVEDGSKGFGPSRLEKHRKACAEYGVSPNQTAWLAGRQQGLRLYCRPENAYRVGRRGALLAPYCTPPELVEAQPAWEHGRRYYEITDDIHDLEREEDRLLFDLQNAANADDTTVNGLRLSVQSSLTWIRLEIQQLQLRRRRYDGWPP